MSKLPFIPGVGTNANILAQPPVAGNVWFATDTKKIYYSDGNSFLSMGGNTGIYYGNMVHQNPPEQGQINFDFNITEINGNESVAGDDYKIPNKDDLILNIPDGCFYRVIGVENISNNIIIRTEKLTIAGGGNNSSSGTTTYLSITTDDGSFVRYFTVDAPSALLKMHITQNPQVEDNKIRRIEYTIGNTQIVEETLKDFGEITLDITNYLPKMSTLQSTKVAGWVYDLYNPAPKYFEFTVWVMDLSLTSGITQSILTTEEQTYHYVCTPIGGNSKLKNGQILIQFYDSENNKLNNDIIEEVKIANVETPIEIIVPDFGVYTMSVQYRGQLETSDQWIYSNAVYHQIVYYNKEPQLIANIPTMSIEQYSTLKIDYMIAAVTDSVDKIKVQLIKRMNGEELENELVEVLYTQLNEWNIYFEAPGLYDLTIEASGMSKTFSNVRVTEYAGSLPQINTSGLTLNLTAVNRSNNAVNKDTWTSGNYYCDFNNFSWGNINGWLKDEDGIDMLRLSSGASLTVANFRPFVNDAMINGQTIELDFKFSGVTDFSQPLISCLSYGDDGTIQAGFHVTGQESTFNTNIIKATGGSIQEDDSESAQIYNTAIQGLTAKYVENKRIHLTWVIERRSNSEYPMIKTYINGICCGITQYDKDDVLEDYEGSKAYITLNSNAGIIDIYNIRVYQNSVLAPYTILNNYIATAGSIEDRVAKFADNSPVLNTATNKISVEEIENAAQNSGYQLRLPYIKIIGGTGLLKNDEGYTKNKEDNDCRLPTAKKDYRLIKEYRFIDPKGNRDNQELISTFKEDDYLNGLVMYGQGTSSMEYPVKNLRIKAKMKDANNNKVKFKVNDCSVDLICLKADYMESSGSHNTGTGNLIYNLTKNLGLETPGQEYWTKEKVGYDTVSAIRGFPVLVFFKEETADENAPYEFIGKYNFNLDKATHEPFGFMHDEDGTFGWDPEYYKAVNILSEKAFNNYPFDLYKRNEDNTYSKLDAYDSTINQYYSIWNTIHCYEFLNNADNLDNFEKNEGDKDFKTTFYKNVMNDGKEVPAWYTCYESRYPEFEDYQSTDIDSWFRLCEWVNSTKDDLNKFKTEFADHFNFEFTCFYYILTHVLLMIDSRAKNMMIATWNETEWFPIFYDMDTMLGLNNYGYNKFNYDTEDSAANVYNGQASILWNNFKRAFASEIQDFYQRMQDAGLTAEKLIQNYNDAQADAANENIYNADSAYKYIRTFSEPYVDGDGDIVESGTKDYLYASQGNRSMHREWWLYNRINYFNGKYLSNAYKSDKYVMRLYTPQSGETYYIPQYDLTKEEFDNSIESGIIYWIKDGDNWTRATEEFDINLLYHIALSSTDKLDKSLAAVPPNNNFELTPLNNQYLSVAFGGDNGDTVGPIYAMANIPTRVNTPSGKKYNDTETYVYGGSLLKDLGDLSPQYLGQFHFPNKQTKLEYLTLGNRHKDYYNPNFSSLRIGNSAPYLKQLEITNCIGLAGRSLDVSYCQNLISLYATGTGLNGVTLPENGVLTELRLPETIKSLKLVNQSKLTDSNFTIGTWDYDTSSYVDINQIGSQTDDQTGKINRLWIEDTNIDSYAIVKNNPLQRFYLKNINWTINNINDIDNNSVKVLDQLLKLKPIDDNMTLGQALTGTITFSTSLGLTKEAALAIYNKYAIEDINNPGKFFPNINFVFEDLDIFNVNILDGNGNVYWTRKIAGNAFITKEFLSSGPKGAFTIPTRSDTIDYTHEFIGRWNTSYGDTDLQGSQNKNTLYWPIFEDKPITADITLTPNFNSQLRVYQIIFTDGNDFSVTIDAAYGTKIKNIVPIELPYKDDSDLDLYMTYSFEGYNNDPTASVGVTFDDNALVTGNKTYYAIFEKKSVYDNIHLDYWDFTITENNAYGENYNDPDPNFHIQSGYQIRPKEGLGLRGKVTIPDMYNNLPVYKLQNEAFRYDRNKEINNQPTHVFIKKNNNNNSNLRVIGEYAFSSKESILGNSIIYFDFNDGLRYISSYSFHLAYNLQPVDGVINFGNNILHIGYMAFNQSFNLLNSPCTFSIAPTIRSMDGYAISNFAKNIAFGNVIDIGRPDRGAELDLNDSYNQGSDYRYIIRCNQQNGRDVISMVQFYTNKYESATDIVNSQNDTVALLLGEGIGVTDVQVIQPTV